MDSTHLDLSNDSEQKEKVGYRCQQRRAPSPVETLNPSSFSCSEAEKRKLVQVKVDVLPMLLSMRMSPEDSWVRLKGRREASCCCCGCG